MNLVAALCVPALGALLIATPVSTSTVGSRSSQDLEALQAVVEKAMKNSPKVQLAEAKVVQAEVELKQVRMEVVRQVLQLSSDLQDATNLMQRAYVELEESHKLRDGDFITEEAVRKTEQDVIRARTRIDQIELEMDFLQGEIGFEPAPDSTADYFADDEEISAQHPGLDSEAFSVGFEEVPLRQAVDQIMQGSEISVVFKNTIPADGYMVSLELNGSRRDHLTAVSDLCGWVFLVRDYGLLMTTPEQAQNYLAATIPPDFRRRQ